MEIGLPHMTEDLLENCEVQNPDNQVTASNPNSSLNASTCNACNYPTLIIPYNIHENLVLLQNL